MAVVIRRDLSGTMRHVVHVGEHEFNIDEPPAVGGEDSGPTPHDLYDAAVGACKAMTMVWYARRKAIPLEDVEVTVVRDDSAERSGTYRLRASIRLGGPITSAQRDQLLDVASRCPVHKLMTQSTTEIETVLE
ncbi:MAG: OsmC family protein [Proteobacteria bacterium]|nr:OsmC family protein [Pseudomonadota bacterium]HQR04094.1 OsmC family protein [Rhodocyclaceae bacterium]